MKRHALLVCVCATLGCGANKPAPTSRTQPPAGNREPWFCQVGRTDEEWQCIQSETLAADPKPTRLPQPRPPAAESRAPKDFDIANRPPPAAEQAPVAAPPPQPAPRTDSAPQPTARDQPDVPRHVALSYRPEKPVAILDLPADFYAVQLVAVSSKETLEDFARKHKIRGMSAARVWNGNQLFYVLLLGIYETRAKAQAAIDSLGAPFDTMQPWIRSLGSLQKAMLDADREAGTTEI